MLKIPMGSVVDLKLSSKCDYPLISVQVTLITPEASYTQSFCENSPIVEVDTTKLSLGVIRAKLEYSVETPRGIRVVIKVINTPYEIVSPLV